MLGHYLDHFEVLNGHTLITRLARHTRTLEDLSRIRTRTYRPGSTKTVVLTVRSLTDTAEAVTLDYTLESLTLGGTDDVDEYRPFEEIHVDHITQIILAAIEPLELGQVSLGSNASLLEVTLKRLGRVLFLSINEPKLKCFIAILSRDLICVTTQGPTSITVHGMFFPSALNTDVIPIFFPNKPGISVSY